MINVCYSERTFTETCVLISPHKSEVVLETKVVYSLFQFVQLI